MPLSKNLATFPVLEYLTIFAKASRDGNLEIPCESKADAIRTRQEMYHILNLIRKENDLVGQEPYKSLLAQLADQPVVISLEGTRLVFRVRSTSAAKFARELLLFQPDLLKLPQVQAQQRKAGLTDTFVPPAAIKQKISTTLAAYGLGEEDDA